MNYKGLTYVPLRTLLNMTGSKTDWYNNSVNIKTTDEEKAKESVVEIYIQNNGQDVSQGSGVLYEYNKILTCHHVIDNGDTYKIIFNDGSTVKGKLSKDMPDIDIALLEVKNTQFKPVKIGDSEELNKGDYVYTISSPKEKRNVISKGIYKEDSWSEGCPILITSAFTQQGSSGGGLFDNDSNLVGIIEAGGENEYKGDSFSIPINDIRSELTK
jgi:S1-C subfamily serine protease